MTSNKKRPLKECALIAQESPRKAFYYIRLELDAELNVVVTKKSGITVPRYRVCDQRAWGFAKDFAKALKFYDMKIREKLRGGHDGQVRPARRVYQRVDALPVPGYAGLAAPTGEQHLMFG